MGSVLPQQNVGWKNVGQISSVKKFRNRRFAGVHGKGKPRKIFQTTIILVGLGCLSNSSQSWLWHQIIRLYHRHRWHRHNHHDHEPALFQSSDRTLLFRLSLSLSFSLSLSLSLSSLREMQKPSETYWRIFAVRQRLHGHQNIPRSTIKHIKNHQPPFVSATVDGWKSHRHPHPWWAPQLPVLVFRGNCHLHRLAALSWPLTSSWNNLGWVAIQKA